jgi:hypothetical protein
MAFVDGTVAVSATHEMSADTSATMQQKPSIRPADRRRIRLAGGLIAALVLIDLALYLPRVL